MSDRTGRHPRQQCQYPDNATHSSHITRCSSLKGQGANIAGNIVTRHYGMNTLRLFPSVRPSTGTSTHPKPLRCAHSICAVKHGIRFVTMCWLIVIQMHLVIDYSLCFICPAQVPLLHLTRMSTISHRNTSCSFPKQYL